MSAERVQAELELLRERYRELEYEPEGHWCRLPRYKLPDGWSATEVELAFQIPADLPGQAPYAFWLRPPLTLNGRPPNNTSGPVATGFGDGWQQWSWQLDPWQPGSSLEAGTNMLDFVRSIAHRLRELD